jgi:hypothetical protein
MFSLNCQLMKNGKTAFPTAFFLREGLSLKNRKLPVSRQSFFTAEKLY